MNSVYKGLSEQLSKTEQKDLPLWKKDFEEMIEAKQIHIENKDKELDRTKRLNEMILNKDAFKKINPEWEYEKFEEYWEIKLANQVDYSKSHINKIETEIESSKDEKKIYEDMLIKVKALLGDKDE